MTSIFSKSQALTFLHIVFKYYTEMIPGVGEFQCLTNLFDSSQSAFERLACLINDKLALMLDMLEHTDVLMGNKVYEIAQQTAKLQYKSPHAIACLYDL
ncbi:unnamed protein product [Didymodactylos carnosus]|uniref:Uncharacterized protein n=1 Tax=Didymodactylos carnosus TaxID=1234261 RepID=A0A814WZI4_9BILA|nr:unnamed protein product [Didymodactylos carnosus]CAF1212387.1 unnamed protein product [Didymodactylos carnosus]CAF3730347.1 unnamed protein product [Didymodactylos carnosus]CAF3976360.1 unnamed protein product [Didymodactylos carnosus]